MKGVVVPTGRYLNKGLVVPTHTKSYIEKPFNFDDYKSKIVPTNIYSNLSGVESSDKKKLKMVEIDKKSKIKKKVLV